MDEWLRSSFFLPFSLTWEIDQFGAPLSNKVFQAPVAPSTKHYMYCKFSTSNTKVLKILCWYRVRRYIQINHTRNVFRSHCLDQ